ncbi:DUF3592 domain-containing protein [Sulfurovum sp.]|uniref:DUF3592 domain-containing protein n=1 Tax=Sulfurovum sp. TaxID=1969726 RepID=UPI003568013C
MNIEFEEKDGQSKYSTQIMLLVLGLMLSFPILLSEYNIEFTAAVVFFLMLYFSYRIIRIKRVKNWQKVPCQIEAYKIIQHQRYDQDNNIPSLDYEVSIAYDYRYQEVLYRSERVGIDTSQYLFKSEGMFETDEALRAKSIDYLKRILDQSEQHAYVDPYNPKEAVLDNLVSTKGLMRWVGCLLITVLVFVGIIYVGTI